MTPAAWAGVGYVVVMVLVWWFGWAFHKAGWIWKDDHMAELNVMMAGLFWLFGVPAWLMWRGVTFLIAASESLGAWLAAPSKPKPKAKAATPPRPTPPASEPPPTPAGPYRTSPCRECGR